LQISHFKTFFDQERKMQVPGFAESGYARVYVAGIDRMIKRIARGEVWDEFQRLALRLYGR
jgi:hypothetical protein